MQVWRKLSQICKFGENCHKYSLHWYHNLHSLMPNIQIAWWNMMIPINHILPRIEFMMSWVGVRVCQIFMVPLFSDMLGIISQWILFSTCGRVPDSCRCMWLPLLCADFWLTLYGPVMPYGDIDLGNIGLGNGLLPDGIKPLPEPMLTYQQLGLVTFT